MMDIQEYRKASAEKLGFYENIDQVTGWCYRLTDSNLIIPVKEWQPDINANQMLMVWEWMRDNLIPHPILIPFYKWIYDGEDILLATAKAFMEYIKTCESEYISRNKSNSSLN